MDGFMEIFTDGDSEQTAAEDSLFYDAFSSEDLQYLTIKDMEIHDLVEFSANGIFIGIAVTGAALMMSLGIAAIIRIFRAA